MAVPPILIKLAAAAGTDKRTWKVVGIVIAAALAPIIISIMLIGTIVSSIEAANDMLFGYVFMDKTITQTVTSEQLETLNDMRTRLGNLKSTMKEYEGSLDENLVKAVFYCLNFGREFDDDEFDYNAFCECFEEMSLGDLDEIILKLDEEFPQYTNSEDLKSDVEEVYERLKGET